MVHPLLACINKHCKIILIQITAPVCVIGEKIHQKVLTEEFESLNESSDSPLTDTIFSERPAIDVSFHDFIYLHIFIMGPYDIFEVKCGAFMSFQIGP